jgi:hypothetical protein
MFGVLASVALVGAAGCDSGDSPAPGAGGDATGLPADSCAHDVPEQIDGADTGFSVCDAAVEHRVSKTTCPSPLPRDGVTCHALNPSGPPDTCSVDADCTDHPNGACQASSFPTSPGNCTCSYGCTSDADCGAHQICSCGSPLGVCVDATCTSDADCTGGMRCAAFSSQPGCDDTAFACESPDDVCRATSDCPDGQSCTMKGDHRVCSPPVCEY